MLPSACQRHSYLVAWPIPNEAGEMSLSDSNHRKDHAETDLINLRCWNCDLSSICRSTWRESWDYSQDGENCYELECRHSNCNFCEGRDKIGSKVSWWWRESLLEVHHLLGISPTARFTWDLKTLHRSLSPTFVCYENTSEGFQGIKSTEIRLKLLNKKTILVEFSFQI